MKSKKVHVRSVLPIYGIGVAAIIYCLIFPLYSLGHFFILAAVCVGVYLLLSKVFPGETVTVEEPITTGDSKIDALLAEGERAVSEMTRLRDSISNVAVKGKIDSLIDITKKIFMDVTEDPGDYDQIHRFANYFLPTTLKLLNSYDRFCATDVQGENVRGAMDKIENVLDATITAYNRQYDALFSNQALDIETDIEVLKTMMKREGLTDKDF